MLNFTFPLALVASAVISALAADVNILGTGLRSGLGPRTAIGATATSGVSTKTTRARGSTLDVIGAQSNNAPTGVDTGIRIASSDILNRPTALLNKNALTTGNNIFITRSNLIFTQNDRMAMRKRVHEALETASSTATTSPMGTAILTKSVLRAVSAPATDTTLQTKARAVVAAKAGDQTTLSKLIADFVDAAAQREMDHEQAQSQSQTPSGAIVLIGTKDILRQPAAIVNKNIALTDDQINIARSNLAPTQNDQVRLSDTAKVADAILPGSIVDVAKLNAAKREAKTETTETTTKIKTADEGEGEGESEGGNYRVAFIYPKNREHDGESGRDRQNAPLKQSEAQNKEQLGVWGPGWGMGWRYPLSYWNSCGPSLYGAGCGLGLAAGPYYYC